MMYQIAEVYHGDHDDYDEEEPRDVWVNEFMRNQPNPKAGQFPNPCRNCRLYDTRVKDSCVESRLFCFNNMNVDPRTIPLFKTKAELKAGDKDRLKKYLKGYNKDKRKGSATSQGTETTRSSRGSSRGRGSRGRHDTRDEPDLLPAEEANISPPPSFEKSMGSRQHPDPSGGSLGQHESISNVATTKGQRLPHQRSERSEESAYGRQTYSYGQSDRRAAPRSQSSFNDPDDIESRVRRYVTPFNEGYQPELSIGMEATTRYAGPYANPASSQQVRTLSSGHNAPFAPQQMSSGAFTSLPTGQPAGFGSFLPYEDNRQNQTMYNAPGIKHHPSAEVQSREQSSTVRMSDLSLSKPTEEYGTKRGPGSSAGGSLSSKQSFDNVYMSDRGMESLTKSSGKPRKKKPAPRDARPTSRTTRRRLYRTPSPLDSDILDRNLTSSPSPAPPSQVQAEESSPIEKSPRKKTSKKKKKRRGW